MWNISFIIISKIGFQKGVSPQLSLYSGISKETDALKMAAIESGGGTSNVAQFAPFEFVNSLSVLYTPRNVSSFSDESDEYYNLSSNAYLDYTWAVELTASFSNCFYPNQTMADYPGFANLLFYEYEETPNVSFPFSLFLLSNASFPCMSCRVRMSV